MASILIRFTTENKPIKSCAAQICKVKNKHTRVDIPLFPITPAIPTLEMSEDMFVTCLSSDARTNTQRCIPTICYDDVDRRRKISVNAVNIRAIYTQSSGDTVDFVHRSTNDIQSTFVAALSLPWIQQDSKFLWWSLALIRFPCPTCLRI